MRITFVLPGFPRKPVGGYRVAYEYANHLVRRGHRVAVVHPSWLPPGSHPPGGGITMGPRRALDGLRNLVLRPSISWLEVDPRVRMIFAPWLTAAWAPDADAVVATWWATAKRVAAWPAAKGRGYHLIQSFEDWGGPEERVISAWRLPLLKIVVSRWLLEKARQLGIEPDQVTHIPNAVDHDVFRPPGPITDRGPSVALMVSSQPLKGTTDAMAALERARRRFPQLTARAFGTDRRPRGMPGWIEYVCLPSPDELASEVYGSASIFLSASHSEGWGLPGAEAMACGCALVSTDHGGVRDYARPDETALLSPPGDVAALADALEALLGDPERRISLARAAVEAIRSFTWDRSTDRLEKVLGEGLRDSTGETTQGDEDHASRDR